MPKVLIKENAYTRNKRTEGRSGHVSETLPVEIVKTKITLSITQEDRDAVKIYALKNHTTVSDLFHEWIQQTCGE